MVALPAWPYVSVLFLRDISFFEWFMVARKNIALPHYTNAVTATINLAGCQRSFTDGSFSNGRIFHPGQPATDAHSNSKGMESCSCVFACSDIRSLCEYQQHF